MPLSCLSRSIASSVGVGAQPQPEGGHVGVVGRGWEASRGVRHWTEMERAREDEDKGGGRSWRMRRETRRGVADVTIEGDDTGSWLAGLMMLEAIGNSRKVCRVMPRTRKL